MKPAWELYAGRCEVCRCGPPLKVVAPHEGRVLCFEHHPNGKQLREKHNG
jgi:hypothetical protein